MSRSVLFARFRPLFRAALAALVLASGLVVLRSPEVEAATRPFSSRFSTNAQGDIVFVANTLLQCPASNSACAGALAGSGSALNNNSYAMVPVDTDGDASTSNSSSANLVLPAGATVLFARLYWGAVSSSGSRNQARFRVPGATAYSTVTAPVVDDSGNSYQASVDVTGAVVAAGAGTYIVGGIQLSAGAGSHAGWSMVVAYADPAGVMRNLTVFDGFNTVSSGPININVSGFLTPPVGPVNTKLGVVAYEGDLGTTGDQLFLNNVAMSDSKNATNNFFNATVTNTGNSVTNRSPSDVNTMGFDADIISVPNSGNAVLANSATSAAIRLTTGGDVYYPGVVTFVTDLYAPRISVDKTFSDVNGGNSEPGDIVEYAITVSNTGKDPAVELVLRDAIPVHTTYVPNSLQIVSGANAGAKSDSTGNDQAQFAANATTFFLGTGATGTVGGRLNENETTSVKFRVRIDASAPDGVPIPNQADVTFKALTLGSVSVTPSIIVPVVIRNETDLQITKTDGVTSVVPGTTTTYTIKVRNAGANPVPISNATVTDTLPTTLTGATWSCSATGGSNCDGSSGAGSIATSVDLSPGGEATFVLTATVVPGATGTLQNTVSVTPPTGVTDSNGTNNSATDVDVLTPIANLAITKTNSVTTVVPGSSIAYTVVASNAGPSAVTGALVTDNPPGASGTIAWTCLATSGSLCPASGNGPIGALVDLAPSGTATFTITYTVAADMAFNPIASTTLRNDATIAAPSGVNDPTGSNNSAFDSDPLTPQSDLSITKTHLPAAIVPGDPVSYTITVTNAGPSAAPTAAVADVLPSGFTVSSISTSAWSCATATTFPCMSTNLRPGATTIVVNGSFAPWETGSRTNTATVTSPSDTNAANNTAADTSILAPSADLKVSKSHRPINPVAGSTFTYEIDVTNVGPSVASSAALADALPASPAGLTIVPGSIVADSPWDCSASTTINLSCSAPTLTVGASKVIMQVRVPAGTPGLSTISNTVTAASATLDPTTGNTSTDTATVIAQADLAIAKTRAVSVFTAGGPVQWTITVTNRGPSDVTGALINDPAPIGVSGLTWSCNGVPSCPAPGSGAIAGVPLDLASGSTATFTYQGTLSASWNVADPVINTATVTPPSGVTDPNTANNAATDTTLATLRAAYSVAKTNNQATLVPGTRTTYTVTVANAGPSSPSGGVGLVDTLPSELDPSTATWSCAPAAACTPSSGTSAVTPSVVLAAGAKATIVVSADIRPDAVGAVTNTATIATLPVGVTDPDLSDNSATDSDPLVPRADLGITKTMTGGDVAGESVSYTVRVENRGPSSTTATIADALPAAVINPSAWTCLAAGPGFSSCPGAVAGNLAAAPVLPPGGVATYTMSGTVDPTFRGTLSNTATVVAPSGVDQNPDNDSATAMAEVRGVVALAIAKTDGVTTIGAGSNVTYTVTVGNAGPSTAMSAPITDVLPALLVGATWTCAAIAPNSCGSPSGSGSLATTATISPSGSVTYSITGTVSPSARTQISNSATVDTPADSSEVNRADNTATDTDTVTANGALTVTKTSSADPGPVSSGQQITYIVTVANAGPAAMAGVPVTDSPPGKLRDVSWTCAPTGGATCAPSGVGGISTSVNLPSGSATIFTITATVTDLARNQIANTASASLPADVNPVTTGSPRTVNATNTLTVAPRADLSITKTNSTTTVVPGETTIYTIVVSNAGPAAVINAPVVDTPPVALLDVTWSCSASAGSLCAAGGGTNAIATAVSLPPGGTATFLLTGTVNAFAHLGGPPSLANTATITTPSDVTEITGPGSSPNNSTDTDTYAPTGDLVITKTDGVLSAVPGTTTSYAIVVTNKGPSAVADAALTDAVPAQITNVAWSCSVFGVFNDCSVPDGTGSAVSTLLDLAPGASATVTVQGRIAPDARGSIANTASVATPPGFADPTPTNSATDTTTLDPRADLLVTKEVVGSLVPGTTGTWKVTVTNTGPSSVAPASVSDSLPGSVTAISWTCAVPADPLNSCAASGVGDLDTVPVGLAPGASAVFTVTGLIDPSTTGDLVNTATVTAPGDVVDPIPANNSSTATRAVEPSADVAIVKTKSGPIVPGQPVTYTINVSNAGPSAAPGIRVLDPIPSVLMNPTWSCSGAIGACASATGIGDIDATVSLGPNTNAVFTVIASVPSTATGTITNTAQALTSSGVSDPNPNNNSSADSGVAQPRADLSITKTDGAVSMAPGNLVTYSVVVTNDGPSAVPGALVTDTLPTILRSAVWTCSAPTGSSCGTRSGNGDINAQVSLSANAAATFTITALVDPLARGTLTNTAGVQPPSSVDDPTPGNNSAGDSTTLVPVADLRVAKSVVGSLTPGARGRWTMAVTNLGPSAVAGASASDVLGPDLSSAAWTCSVPAGSGNNCAVPAGTGPIATTVDLLPGATATYVLDADIDPAARGTLSNTATVAVPSGISDPATENDSSTAVAPLRPQSDLAVTKSHSGQLVPGSPVTYVIEVVNNGPSTVEAATLTDDLPPVLTNATWTCAVSGGGSCTPASGASDPSVDYDLAVGETAVVTVNATIDEDARGTLANSAIAVLPADTTDTSPRNNTATDNGPLVPKADLSVTKTHTGTVVPGANVTYTVTVANAGPSSALAARVVDTLPASLTRAVWSCSATAGSSCPGSGVGNVDTTIDLASGGAATFVLTATVDPRATGTVSNSTSASTAPGTQDPNPGNNNATDGGNSVVTADLQIRKIHSGEFVAGRPLTWQIIVTNAGPSAVAGAAIVDTPPAGVTGATWNCGVPTEDGNACGAGSGTGSIATTVDLLPGASATLFLTGALASTATGLLSNTATVTAPSGVVDIPGNNSAADADSVVRLADLTISKTHTPNPVVPGGGPATYTISVWNNGPSSSPASLVTDLFDPRFDNSSVTWTCAPTTGAMCPASGSGDLNGVVTDLAANSGATFTITAPFLASATGTVPNAASVATPPGVSDPDPSSNSVNDPGTLQPVSDIRVTKRVVGAVVPGRRVTFEVTVRNSGPSSVVDASVVDVLPAGLTDGRWSCTATPAPSSALAACNSAAGTVPANGSLTAVDLGPSQEAAFTIDAFLDPSYRGNVVNTAAAATSNGEIDPDSTNNDGTSSTPTAPESDLAAVKSITSGPAVPGQPITWAIDVTNNGPSTVTAASVHDVLPAAVSDISWTCSVASASTIIVPGSPGVSFTNGCAITAGTGDVSNSVDLAPGVTARITVTATVDPSARGEQTSGDLVNTATAEPPPGVVDPVAINDRGLVRAPLVPRVDLIVTKTSIGDVVAGAPVVYEIVVTNAGPSTAVDALLSDSVPSVLGGVTWTCRSSGGRCAPSSGSDDPSTFLTLAPGASATVRVVATIDSAATGTLANTATATPKTGETDTDPIGQSDNSSTDRRTIDSRADLSVTKTHSGSLVPGQRGTWTIVVTSAGPSFVTDAVVTDVLPAELTDGRWTCAVDGPGSCGSASGAGSIATTVSLGTTGVATFVLSALIDPTSTGLVQNVASVVLPPATTDPDPTRNTATDSGPAVPTADLRISKRHEGELVPGSYATYLIDVTNSGPSAVNGATVRDTLPGVFSDASWTCDAASPNSCADVAGTGSIGSSVSLRPGATATYRLRALLASTASSAVVNTASVGAPAGVIDPQPSNDQSVDDGSTSPVADLKIEKTLLGEARDGAVVRFEVVVSNAGPSAANGVEVTDILPLYLSTPRWTCAATTGSTCAPSGAGSLVTTADLAPDGRATYLIEAVLGAGSANEVVNTASVTPPVGVTDPTMRSNQATARGPVVRPQPFIVPPTTVLTGPSSSIDPTPSTSATQSGLPPATTATTVDPPRVTPVPGSGAIRSSDAPPTTQKPRLTGISPNDLERTSLSLTGTEVLGRLLIAVGLLGGGLAMVLVARRRPRSKRR